MRSWSGWARGTARRRGRGDEQRVDLGTSLFIPYRYTEDRMFRALQDAGFDDWTLAQCRVFQCVAPDGSRLTDLADQAQMSKQSAGVLVDQLERLGYVRRVPDPTDGRARLIVIEERGRRAVEAASATLGEILSEWKTYLGTRNFTLLHQILDQLREITDPYARKTRPRRVALPRSRTARAFDVLRGLRASEGLGCTLD
ncbi:MarR family transcriptional regulator [Streptomyces sp. SID11233]|nr:MarR family transcriptional regulator [Streptomyces sp. SID11233]